MSKELEALDKLEECAEGMKDLPKSNWIDLAENEAELDLKIMDWVETIKFELFKGKQALQRLEQIDNAKPSEALKELEQMREFGNHFWVADKVNKSYMTIKEYILSAQEQEDENSILKACIRDWEDDYKHLEYALHKEKEVLRIIFEKNVDIINIRMSKTVDSYNYSVSSSNLNRKELTQEEFDLLKRYCEEKDESE